MSKKVVEAGVSLTLHDGLTAGLNRIQARLNRLTSGLGVGRLGRSFSDLGARINGLGPALTSSIGRLSTLTGLLGLGAGGLGAVLYGTTKSVADIGAELTESSFKLGIGVEALQEYRFAANMAGIENASLNTAIQKLGINAANAANGNKGLAETFASLGVSVRDSAGDLRDTESVLDDTLAALAGVKDPAARNALAFKLFGKSGVDMVKMLADGEQGLIDMRQEARETGHVMDEAAAAMGDEFGDNVDRLMKRLEGLRNFLGVQLLPVFNDLVQRVTSWVSANQKLIRSTISEWVSKLASGIRELLDPASDIRGQISGLVEGFNGFLRVVEPLSSRIGGLNIAAGILALWIGGPLINAIAALTPALVKLGIALLTTPIGWVIGGIALLAGAIYLLIDNWDAVVAAWQAAWDYISTGVTNFVADMTAEWDTIKIKLGTAFENARVAIVSKWDEIVAWGAGLGDQIRSWFAIDLYAVGSAIVQSLIDGLTAAWANLTGFLDSKIAELTAGLPDFIKSSLGIEIAPTLKSNDEIEAMARQKGDFARGQVPGVGAFGTGLGASAEEVAANEQARNRAFQDAYAAEIARLQIQNAQLKSGNNFGVGADLGGAGQIAPAEVQTQTVQAGTVTATSMTLPEPLLTHQPQTVNAPYNGGPVTIHVQGVTAAQVQTAIQNAFGQQAEKHRQNMLSSLSD
jgi:hypothetical protein